MVSPLVAGYSFWASEVLKLSVFMKEFEDLKASVGFTKEPWEFQAAVKPAIRRIEPSALPAKSVDAKPTLRPGGIRLVEE